MYFFSFVNAAGHWTKSVLVCTWAFAINPSLTGKRVGLSLFIANSIVFQPILTGTSATTGPTSSTCSLSWRTTKVSAIESVAFFGFPNFWRWNWKVIRRAIAFGFNMLSTKYSIDNIFFCFPNYGAGMQSQKILCLLVLLKISPILKNNLVSLLTVCMALEYKIQIAGVGFTLILTTPTQPKTLN